MRSITIALMSPDELLRSLARHAAEVHGHSLQSLLGLPGDASSDLRANILGAYAGALKLERAIVQSLNSGTSGPAVPGDSLGPREIATQSRLEPAACQLGESATPLPSSAVVLRQIPAPALATPRATPDRKRNCQSLIPVFEKRIGKSGLRYQCLECVKQNLPHKYKNDRKGNLKRHLECIHGIKNYEATQGRSWRVERVQSLI